MVDNIAGGDRTKWDFFLNMPLVEFLNAVSFQTEKDRARTERLNTAAQSAKSAKDSTVYKIALLQEMLSLGNTVGVTGNEYRQRVTSHHW